MQLFIVFFLMKIGWKLQYPFMQKVKILWDYNQTVREIIKEDALSVHTYSALTEQFGTPERIAAQFEELKLLQEKKKYEKELKTWLLIGSILLVLITTIVFVVSLNNNDLSIIEEPAVKESTTYGLL